LALSAISSAHAARETAGGHATCGRVATAAAEEEEEEDRKEEEAGAKAEAAEEEEVEEAASANTVSKREAAAATRRGSRRASPSATCATATRCSAGRQRAEGAAGHPHRGARRCWYYEVQRVGGVEVASEPCC